MFDVSIKFDSDTIKCCGKVGELTSAAIKRLVGGKNATVVYIDSAGFRTKWRILRGRVRRYQ